MFRKAESINPQSREVDDKEKILTMSPRELADFLGALDKKGTLEKFLEQVAEDDALTAQLSYWEKWLQENQRKLLDEIIEKKKEIYGDKTDNLPLDLNEKFKEEDLKIIFSNIGGIQLTFGCSKGCPFCAFDAVPGAREHISYSRLANLFQKYGKFLKHEGFGAFLSHASEPSDYLSEDKTFEDICQLAERYAGYQPEIVSRETDKPDWIEFLKSYKGGRKSLSVYGFDENKLNELQNKIGKSAILKGKSLKYIRGLGVSSEKFKDKELTRGSGGIGCFDGTLLTPRGLYNIVQLPVSKKFPQGIIIAPIENISNGNALKKGNAMAGALRGGIAKFFYFYPEEEGISERGEAGIGGNIGFLRCNLIRSDGLYVLDFNKKGVITNVIKTHLNKERIIEQIDEHL